MDGKCMEVPGGVPTTGTRIQLYSCNGTAAQQWTNAGDGSLQALGKCLDVMWGGTAAGTGVWLWDCNGTPAQQWRVTVANLLINPQSGRCLDTGGNSADGTLLQIWDCNGTAAQIWHVPGAPAGIQIPSEYTWGELALAFVNVTPRCLDEPYGSASPGLHMQVFHCWSGPPQRWVWQIRPGLDNGDAYRLVNANTGMCIGLPQQQPIQEFTPVIQADCSTSDTFNWVPVQSAVAPHIQLHLSIYPYLCLGVANSSLNDHTPVVLRTCQTPTVFNEPNYLTWQID